MNAIQTETPSTTPLTAAQYQRVQRLGAPYGHLYADAMCAGQHSDGEACDQHDGTVSPADIADAVSRLGPWGPGGIAWPVVDRSGNVIHTTGSGRLRWTVERSGAANLDILRPSGAVCAARVSADDRIAAMETAVGASLHTRHVHALHLAIQAALGLVSHPWDAVAPGEEPVAVREALAPLYAAALPDGDEVVRQCPHCGGTNYVLETMTTPRCHVCGRSFAEPVTERY